MGSEVADARTVGGSSGWSQNMMRTSVWAVPLLQTEMCLQEQAHLFVTL